jgi:hypothetical protein
MLDHYIRPIVHLLDDWEIKAAIAAALATLTTLLDTDVKMLAAVAALVFIDFLTGARAAHRRGERITSRGMRRTTPKVVDYALFLAAFIVAGNAFPMLDWWTEWAIGFIALTEIKSIVANVFGPRAVALLGAVVRDPSKRNVLATFLATDDEAPAAASLPEEAEEAEARDEADEAKAPTIEELAAVIDTATKKQAV